MTPDELAARSRARNLRKLMRGTRSTKSRLACEVVVCAKRGPHRCDQRAGFDLDGRAVCAHHYLEARHKAVFSNAEAIALFRKDRKRLEIDRPISPTTEAT